MDGRAPNQLRPRMRIGPRWSDVGVHENYRVGWNGRFQSRWRCPDDPPRQRIRERGSATSKTFDSILLSLRYGSMAHGRRRHGSFRARSGVPSLSDQEADIYYCFARAKWKPKEHYRRETQLKEQALFDQINAILLDRYKEQGICRIFSRVRSTRDCRFHLYRSHV